MKSSHWQSSNSTSLVLSHRIVRVRLHHWSVVRCQSSWHHSLATSVQPLVGCWVRARVLPRTVTTKYLGHACAYMKETNIMDDEELLAACQQKMATHALRPGQGAVVRHLQRKEQPCLAIMPTGGEKTPCVAVDNVHSQPSIQGGGKAQTSYFSGCSLQGVGFEPPTRVCFLVPLPQF